MSDCKKITDKTAISLSKYSSKLSQLNLDSCTSITDQALKFLRYAPELKALDLFDNKPICVLDLNSVWYNDVKSPLEFEFL